MYWIVQAFWRMRLGKSMILPAIKNSANLLFKKLPLFYMLQHTLDFWEREHLCIHKVFLWLSCVSLQSSVNRDIALMNKLKAYLSSSLMMKIPASTSCFLFLLLFSSGVNALYAGQKHSRKIGCVFLYLLRVKSKFYIKYVSYVSKTL